MDEQTIKDASIPIIDTTLEVASSTVAQPSTITAENPTPQQIPNPPIAVSPVAQEVISTSLDTQSRRILGSFSFGQVGAIKIGTYNPGSSGEIDISSSGITAKNSSGTTTFTLDGTTGNATFLGTLAAGTLVGGDGLVKLADNGGGQILINDGTNDRVLLGYLLNGF